MFFFRRNKTNKKVYAFSDHVNAGNDVVRSARRLGAEVHLLDRRDSRKIPNDPDVYVFARPPARPTGMPESFQKAYKDLLRLDMVTMVPSAHEFDFFENKIAQAKTFSRWMPRTWHITSDEEAYGVLENVQFPLISKSSNGFRSNNVRLVKDVDAARKEIELAFGGEGIPLFQGHLQKGYLLWQKFIGGCRGDWKVTVIAKKYFMMDRRYNREDRPFASGGRIEPVTDPDDNERAIFAFCLEIVRANDLSLAAMDIVKDRAGKYFLLESSCAWGMRREAAKSAIFELKGDSWSKTKYTEARVYELIGEAIVKGEFDR